MQDVTWKPVANAAMLAAMEPEPVAAWLAMRPMSLVTAVCSSTEAAMAFWLALTRWMVWVIEEIALVTSPEPVSMSWTEALTAWVALAASWARPLTSSATTAKPRPYSPACADSMVALRASSRVWIAILAIWSSTARALMEASPSWLTVLSATSACSEAARAT